MTTTGFTLDIGPPIERSIDELRALLAPIQQGTGPDVLAGGRLTASLDELIDISRRELASIIITLERFLAAHRAGLDAAESSP